MKKTLLAVILPALFSVSASAATVYEKDGQKFDVYGRVQANIYDKDADGGDNNTLVGTGRLGVKAATAINDQVTAFARGEWQVDAENSTADSFKARHVYAGFDGGSMGKVLFGQTDTPFYDTLAATDIFNEWGDEVYQSGRQEGQVIYSSSVDAFRSTIGYQFADDTKGLSYGYGASLGYAFDFGLGLGAGVESRNYDNVVANTSGVDTDNRWALSTSWGTFGEGFYAAAVYTYATQDYFTAPTTKEKGWELAAAYTLDNNWTFLGGYNRYYEKHQAADVTAYYLLGAQYNFTSKLLAYTEYKFDAGKSDGAQSDDAVTLALQYNF